MFKQLSKTAKHALAALILIAVLFSLQSVAQALVGWATSLLSDAASLFENAVLGFITQSRQSFAV